jgi:tetratricopeptide (TPR) repeat protein
MKERIIEFLLEQMTPTEALPVHEQKRDQVLNLIDKYKLIDKNDISEINNKEKVSCFSIKQKIFIAAGLALVIGVSIVLNSKYSGNINDKLFASYYHPYNINFNSRVYYTKSDMNEAFSLYNTGNYQGVITKLQAVIKTDTSNANAYLLLGISHMEKQNYKEAIKVFTHIGENNFNESTEWYLALCYLKTKQTNKAVPLFNSLANKYYYQSKAEEILNKIEK